MYLQKYFIGFPQQLLMRASLDFNSSPLLDLKLPTELPPINHQRRRRSVLQRLNQQTVVTQPINTDKLSLEKDPSLEDFTKRPPYLAQSSKAITNKEIVTQVETLVKSKYLQRQLLQNQAPSFSHILPVQTSNLLDSIVQPHVLQRPPASTNFFLQNQKMEHHKIKQTIKRILAQQNMISQMLQDIKKNKENTGPVIEGSPRLIDQAEVYKKKRQSVDALENANILKKQPPSLKVNEVKSKIQNGQYSAKIQSHQFDLNINQCNTLAISIKVCSLKVNDNVTPDKRLHTRSLSRNILIGKQQHHRTATDQKLSKLLAKTTLVTLPEEQQHDCSINIKTIEKQERVFPPHLKSRRIQRDSRNRLTINKTDAKNNESKESTADVAIGQSPIPPTQQSNNHFKFQPELSQEQVQQLKSLKYIYKYASNLILKPQNHLKKKSIPNDEEYFSNTMNPLKISKIKRSQSTDLGIKSNSTQNGKQKILILLNQRNHEESDFHLLQVRQNKVSPWEGELYQFSNRKF